MTTAEIIEHLQSDPVLAHKVLLDMPSERKYAFTRHYGISCNESFDPKLGQRLEGLSSSRFAQLVGSGILWLRHPSRVHIIHEHLREQRRQERWSYRFWQWIVVHVSKDNRPDVQEQAKDIEGS